MTALRWDQKWSAALRHTHPVGVRTSSALTPALPPSSPAEPALGVGVGIWGQPDAAAAPKKGEKRTVPCSVCKLLVVGDEWGSGWPAQGTWTQEAEHPDSRKRQPSPRHWAGQSRAWRPMSEQGTSRGQKDRLSGEGRSQGCFTSRPLCQARPLRKALVTFSTHTALPARSPRRHLSLLSLHQTPLSAALLSVPLLSRFSRELSGEQLP